LSAMFLKQMNSVESQTKERNCYPQKGMIETDFHTFDLKGTHLKKGLNHLSKASVIEDLRRYWMPNSRELELKFERSYWVPYL